MSTMQHLLSRHLNPALYHVSVDEAESVATFLLFNLSGQVVGYQQYRPGAAKAQNNDPRAGRYFTYSPKHLLAVFGLETYHFRTDLLFVTEGVFDACRLHNLGLPAVAVLSNNPKGLANFLFAVPRRVVVVADNDPAGRMLMEYGDEVLVCNAGKDLGDMTDGEVQSLLTKYL